MNTLKPTLTIKQVFEPGSRPIENEREPNLRIPVVEFNELPEKGPSDEDILEALESRPDIVAIVKDCIKQREALIAFYELANGDKWFRKDNWCTDAGLDSWYGVTTSIKFEARFPGGRLKQYRTVTRLDLSHNNIYSSGLTKNGYISPRIKDLVDLELLNLCNNFIVGQIPEEIWTLTNLRELYLHFNEFRGGISANIGKLTNLVKVQLDHNRLTGSIPEEIGKLKKLEWFLLHENNLDNGWRRLVLGGSRDGSITLKTPIRLSSPLPAALGSMTNLKEFTVYHNQLTGTVSSAVKKNPNYSNWQPEKHIYPQQDGVELT